MSQKKGGGGALQPPSNPTKPKLKRKHRFRDMIISKVLCNLPFSQNQTPKSADD